MGFVLFCTMLCASLVHGQSVVTKDIEHYFQMVDSLGYQQNRADSLAWVQKAYLERASEGFKKFQKVRDLDPEYYLRNLERYPEFWRTIRPKLEALPNRVAEVDSVLDVFEARLPKFKRPRVCFAVGVLPTGGTIKGDWLLIGAEIVMSDSTTDKSELNSWLQSVMYKEDQLEPFIAHEAIHTQQKITPSVVWGYLFKAKATMTVVEGSADYIPRAVMGYMTINPRIYDYGYVHENELKKEYAEDLKTRDYSDWLNNDNQSVGRPADLGYFIGHQICAACVAQAKDPEKAIQDVIYYRKPWKILKKSGYLSTSQLN